MDTTATPLGLSKWLDEIEQALVLPTQHAASLPSSSDLAFERTLSRSLARSLNTESTRVLSLVSRVLQWSTPADMGLRGGRGELDEDLIKDGAYAAVLDPIERLLEQADDDIEQHLGMGKSRPVANQAVGAKALNGSASSSGATVKSKSAMTANKDRLAPHLLHDPNLARPQLLFPARLTLPRPSVDEKPVDQPLWKPVMRRKLHAKFADEGPDGWLRIAPSRGTDRFVNTTRTEPPSYPCYVHPYERELATLSPPEGYKVPPKEPSPAPPSSFDDTPFEWVDSSETLKRMMDDIRGVGGKGMKELAIDLEHHDTRSWGGMTCLIQLSTRVKDYVIDALDPVVRDELETLNEFLADPSWIKVFHGANSDIIWLQRDFGLYVVGLFDTYHATKVLEFQQHSLASLLEMYTDFVPDKRYQLADWRIRPLPAAMLHYARSDTHYLLAIYDHLRLALHAKALEVPEPEAKMDVEQREDDEDVCPPPDRISPLLEVFNRSISVSSNVFTIAPYDFDTGHFDNGWLGLLAKNGQLKNYATAKAIPTLPIKTGWGPNEVHFEVMRAVHRWREMVARDEDEGTNWILPNMGLWMIAEKVPKDAAELLRIVGGSRGGVSEIVRRRKDDLLGVVLGVVEMVKGNGTKTRAPVEVLSQAMVVEDRGTATIEPAVRPVAALWSDEEVATPSVAVASGSSFFGKAINSMSVAVPAASPALLATVSGFFGSAKRGKQLTPVEIGSDPRSNAVARVLASLVLGGGLATSLQGAKVPEPVARPPIEVEAVEPSDATPTHDDALTGDHSFIPFGDRSTKLSPSIPTKSAPIPKPSNKDVIVVSSLADKPKKRKRPAPVHSTELIPPTNEPIASSSSKQKSKKPKREQREDVVPYDYSQSASILDADPNTVAALTEGKKGKKGKKNDAPAKGRVAKGFVVDTSEFRREPRVNNAPKKGNVSRSFAK